MFTANESDVNIKINSNNRIIMLYDRKQYERDYITEQ